MQKSLPRNPQQAGTSGHKVDMDRHNAELMVEWGDRPRVAVTGPLSRCATVGLCQQPMEVEHSHCHLKLGQMGLKLPHLLSGLPQEGPGVLSVRAECNSLGTSSRPDLPFFPCYPSIPFVSGLPCSIPELHSGTHLGEDWPSGAMPLSFLSIKCFNYYLLL